MTRHFWRLACSSLLLLLATTSLAADRAVCIQERHQLERLQQQVTALGQRQADLNNLVSGPLLPATTLASLLGADPVDEAAVQKALTAPAAGSDALPDNPACRELQANWQQARDDLGWLQADIRRQQHQWLALPTPARQALKSLWRSYRRLEQRRAALPAEAAGVFAAPQLLQVRIMTLLPSLASDADGSASARLLALWQEALAQPLPAAATGATASHQDRALAAFATLQARHQLDLLRRWLWRERRPAFRAAMQDIDMGPLALLTGEARAAGLHLHWLRQTMQQDLLARLGADRPAVALLVLVVRLLFGLSGFLLLLLLARRSVQPLLAASNALLGQSRERRWLAQLAGLLSGMAPLLPWLVLWFGLDLLAPLFRRYDLPLLLALLPLARLYVVYGLSRMIGEWLLQRLAQQAGVYLGAEQTREQLPRLRRFALALTLPWLLLDLVQGSIGASLTLNLVTALALVTAWLALGLLLLPRRQDFVLTLQGSLPPALDPAANRLLQAPLFLLLAPPLLPLLPLLLIFVLRFLHRLLIEFDWYRKLTARWFKLLSQNGEEETTELSAEVPEDYARWFRDEAAAGQELPHIDTGLQAALRKPLQRWLQEHTEENSLLLIGERGIGKSAALDRLAATLAEEMPELQLRRARVPAKTCRPEAVRALVGELLGMSLDSGPAAQEETDAERPPTLVILDDAHNLFLSEVGGLDGWRTVLGLVSAPLENVFWLLAMDNQSWAYLDNVFGRDYPMRNVLRVKPWSQGELRSLILSRHHLSDFRLQYDNTLLSTRGPEAGNVRNAEQRYFSLLWDASHGNPMLALEFWLSSLSAGSSSVTVGLPAEPSRTVLERASGKALFVYAAIAIHENLDSAEIAAVTQLPQSSVQYALKTAFDAGFLYRDTAGRYRLVPLWYHTLTALLARKNLLHE